MYETKMAHDHPPKQTSTQRTKENIRINPVQSSGKSNRFGYKKKRKERKRES